jgi:hypothetical protein
MSGGRSLTCEVEDPSADEAKFTSKRGRVIALLLLIVPLARPPVAAAQVQTAATAEADGLPEIVCTEWPRTSPTDCVLKASRAEGGGAPELDGRLDDPVWGTAQPATGFLQQNPTPGAPASERTEARVLYTDDAVYVGMRMYDSNADGIRAPFVRRDDNAAVSDWASVMFDSYDDSRTAFEFSTTPTGTRVDILHLEDTRNDAAWDAVWDVATSVDGEGWSAEFRIPLSQLRFSGGEDLTWGVNFSRKIARRSETSFWAPIPPTAGKNVSLFGDLVGLENLSAPGGVELLPYMVGRLERAPGDAANPFYHENDTWKSAGLDLKYGVTSNLILTATVNPDFGQVEADPSQVNLGAFETFYAEKRPFFTEGTEIFNFRLQPEGYAFYSRRIGRGPQLSTSVPAGGFAEPPESAPVRGAMKLTGKTSSGWSVGLLNAVTGQVNSKVSGPDGIATQPIEPLTNYAAGRIARDFRQGQSGIGILATSVHRHMSGEVFDRLRSSAYLGAFDWFHRFGANNNYEFNGFVVGTHVRGSGQAMERTQRQPLHFFQRPDADHLTYDPTITSMTGSAAEVALRKVGGNLTWTLGGGSRSPGVELNDLGYLSYGDIWYGSLTARYRDFTASRLFRNWYVEGQAVSAQTFGMESTRPSLHLRMRGTFLNFWQATVNTDFWGEHKWPWDLRGGPALKVPGYTNSRWILRSDSRKSWTVQMRGTVRVDHEGGSHLVRFDPLFDFRPTDRLSTSLGPTFARNRNTDQFVARVAEGDDPTYVVGRIDQTTISMVIRLSYGFSPTINLDVYAQPFLSTGTYTDFRTVDQPHHSDFNTRLPLIPEGTLALDPETNRYSDASFSFRNPDFNVREFRMNAVLRWEYMPGSTLFVVWTQAREDYERLGGLEIGRDLDQLFAAPATNVVMVKVNYWLGL